MDKFITNPCNQYSLLWILYLLQGTLYPEGGIISQALFVVITLVSLYYFFQLMSYSRLPSVLKYARLLLYMYIIYGVLRLLDTYQYGELFVSYRYLKTYLISILPLFVFFYFRTKGHMTIKWFHVFIPIILLTYILFYFKYQANAQMLLGRDEVTNNAGYMFAFMIPTLLLLKKKPILQYSVLVVSILFTVSAIKRGAILIAAMESILFLFVSLMNKKRSTVIITIMLSIGCIIGIYYYVQSMMAESAYFVIRVEQTLNGQSSDRNNIYSFLFDFIMNKMGGNILFGLGADASVRYSGDYAHNDWLETGINNGLFGVVLLLLFFVGFAKSSFAAKNKTTKYVLIFSLLALFARTFFSMSIGDIQLVTSAACGFSLANIKSFSDPTTE